MFTVNLFRNINSFCIKTIFTECNQKIENRIESGHLNRYPALIMYAMGVIHVICAAAAIFLTCSQQHVVDILAVASLGTCSAAAAAA